MGGYRVSTSTDSIPVDEWEVNPSLKDRTYLNIWRSIADIPQPYKANAIYFVRNEVQGEYDMMILEANGVDFITYNPVAIQNATEAIRQATEAIRDETEGFRDEVEADKVIVSADKATTLGYKNAAETAKTQAETARDLAITNAALAGNTRIQDWTAQSYVAGSQVIYQNRHWALPAGISAISTDVPGVSSKWVNILDIEPFIGRNLNNDLALSNESMLNNRLSSNFFVQVGGGAKFLAPYIVELSTNPISTKAIKVVCSKRSVDSFLSDFICDFRIILNEKDLGATKLSIGAYFKFDSTKVDASINSVFYSDTTFSNIILIGATKQISNANAWELSKFEGQTIPSGTKAVTARIRLIGRVDATADVLYNAYFSPWIVNIGSYLTKNIDNGYSFIPNLKQLLPLISNSPIKDAGFEGQQLGIKNSINFPWITSGAGGSQFSAEYEFIEDENPICSRAIRSIHLRRSSDNKNSDFFLGQLIKVPERKRKSTKCSFFYYAKKTSLNVAAAPHIIKFYSDINGTVLISQLTNITVLAIKESLNEYNLIQFENITIPSGTRSIQVIARYQYNSTTLDTAEQLYLSPIRFNFEANIGGLSIKDTENISDWAGRKWCSFGDSLAAAGGFQRYVKSVLGTSNYIRGCGSSAMRFDIGLMAIQPDGTYIARRNTAVSDAAFDAEILSLGYTNLVTSPTWTQYSANPTAYSLPANSYFKIDTKGSSTDRVNTIPLDSELVTVMYANDFGSTLIGNIDDYDNDTVIGQYRVFLERLKNRVPNARVVLCIAPKRTVEWNATTKQRTTEGINSDLLRQAIRDIGKTYGYFIIDFSEIINFNTLNLLSDSVHWNTAGEKECGLFMAKRLALVSSKG